MKISAPDEKLPEAILDKVEEAEAKLPPKKMQEFVAPDPGATNSCISDAPGQP